MIAYIDASVSGVSGDMLLSALIDCGARLEIISDICRVVENLLNCKIKVKFYEVKRKGIKAKKLDIISDSKFNIEDIPRILDEVEKSVEFDREFVENVFKTILDAEKAVHGEAHLHELSNVDTIIDVVGFSSLIKDLNIEKVLCSKIEVGRGIVKTSHGFLSSPAFITAEILKKFKIPFRARINAEASTPTGVAILANIARFDEIETSRIIDIGYGAGEKDFVEAPNVLRIFLLESEMKSEYISILETNLDDVTGELIGNLIDVLYREGALDVQVIQALTKKSRPSFIIKVICNLSMEEKLSKILIKESGTLGVRIFRAEKRHVAERKILKRKIKIKNREFEVRYKISVENDVKHYKPEFDDIKKIAEELKLPFKDVYREAIKRF